MSAFAPKDPDFVERVRASFDRQAFMAHIGAELARVEPGAVDIAMAFKPELRQQHGFFHAGDTVSIADSAGGYAALTLYPPGSGVLTTELKINLLNPARGERLIARGRVVKPGRTLTVTRSDVYGVSDDGETHVATALLTMMCLDGLDD